MEEPKVNSAVYSKEFVVRKSLSPSVQAQTKGFDGLDSTMNDLQLFQIKEPLAHRSSTLTTRSPHTKKSTKIIGISLKPVTCLVRFSRQDQKEEIVQSTGLDICDIAKDDQTEMDMMIELGREIDYEKVKSKEKSSDNGKNQACLKLLKAKIQKVPQNQGDKEQVASMQSFISTSSNGSIDSYLFYLKSISEVSLLSQTKGGF